MTKASLFLRGMLAALFVCVAVAAHPAAAGTCAGLFPETIHYEKMPEKNRPPFLLSPSWRKKYKEEAAKLAQELPEFVFYGDSIVAKWPDEQWQALFPRGRAVNLGISGDTTDGLLWRIRHDHCVVAKSLTYLVLIGTNNIGNTKDKPEKIANDIADIIKTLRQTNPDSKVLLLAILPRNPKMSDGNRINVRKVNKLIRPYRLMPGVSWLDVGSVLLDGRGQLTKDMTYDYLHLTPAGYAAITPLIKEALDSIKKN